MDSCHFYANVAHKYAFSTPGYFPYSTLWSSHTELFLVSLMCYHCLLARCPGPLAFIPSILFSL